MRASGSILSFCVVALLSALAFAGCGDDGSPARASAKAACTKPGAAPGDVGDEGLSVTGTIVRSSTDPDAGAQRGFDLATDEGCYRFEYQVSYDSIEAFYGDRWDPEMAEEIDYAYDDAEHLLDTYEGAQVKVTYDVTKFGPHAQGVKRVKGSGTRESAAADDAEVPPGKPESTPDPLVGKVEVPDDDTIVIVTEDGTFKFTRRAAQKVADGEYATSAGMSPKDVMQQWEKAVADAKQRQDESGKTMILYFVDGDGNAIPNFVQ